MLLLDTVEAKGMVNFKNRCLCEQHPQWHLTVIAIAGTVRHASWNRSLGPYLLAGGIVCFFSSPTKGFSKSFISHCMKVALEIHWLIQRIPGSSRILGLFFTSSNESDSIQVKSLRSAILENEVLSLHTNIGTADGIALLMCLILDLGRGCVLRWGGCISLVFVTLLFPGSTLHFSDSFF